MNHSRIMIAGTNSGCGKTTVTCALIKALQELGHNIVSFKTGPDYVDPMFHNVILKSSCKNIDMFLHDEKTINHLINTNTTSDDIAIIEGVMGFYDGLGGTSVQYSSWDLARLTKTPTILIINGSGISVSLNAVIKGFLDYQENNIVGVIINNISAMFYQAIKPIIEQECQIEVLGFLEKDEQIRLEHRHLGLLMPSEIVDIEAKMILLAQKVSQSIDLEHIVSLSRQARPLNEKFQYPAYYAKLKIAVAYDEAFCFYYQDNLELLKKLGVDIIYFSPLHDQELPLDIAGIIIGGGYPELFVEQLSSNHSMIESIRALVSQKIPIFAECGGFIYLGSCLKVDNQVYPLTNVIAMKSEMTNKLQPFGYVENHCLVPNMLLDKGGVIAAHEFHYIKSDYNYQTFKAVKPLSKRSWLTGYHDEHIFAGFSHYHFYTDFNLVLNFLKKCQSYQERGGIIDEKTTT